MILCHLEGLSRAEAARRLGCPEGTLSVRLSRALEKLRKKLGKPPLAILAGAMVVMLPGFASGEHHGIGSSLRDGTLDDWASPRTLDLYRKAVPMRLLDRFGPALTAVAAAVLILVGASFGWHMINRAAAGGNEVFAECGGRFDRSCADAEKSFAAAVQDLQGKSSKSPGGKASSVHLQIKAAQEKEPRIPGTSKSLKHLATERSSTRLRLGQPSSRSFGKSRPTNNRSRSTLRRRRSAA